MNPHESYTDGVEIPSTIYARNGWFSSELNRWLVEGVIEALDTDEPQGDPFNWPDGTYLDSSSVRLPALHLWAALDILARLDVVEYYATVRFKPGGRERFDALLRGRERLPAWLSEERDGR